MIRPWHGRLRALAGRAAFLVLGVTLALASARWSWGAERRADESRFPHEKHARLFPTCETCHEGVASGDSARRFPSSTSCAECHDGGRYKRVAWEGARVRPTNLRFDHRVHALKAAKDSAVTSCRTCHGTGDTATFMAVSRAMPSTCQSCHAHAAPDHLARTTACSTCHVPLTRAVALSDSVVAALPQPQWHRTAGVLSEHAPLDGGDPLQCSTCHARQSCARCHPNATEVARTAALQPDARVARAVRALRPTYFTPESHEGERWSSTHGDSARLRAASCASCHARPSCTTCHTGRGAAKQIARLPKPDAGGAPGITLQLIPLDVIQPRTISTFPHAPAVAAAPARVAPEALPPGHAPLLQGDTIPTPVRIHPADFARQHGATASSGALNCLGCHEEQQCSSCHTGSGRRRFHAFNFVSRHAASAAGREQDCSSCHNTETFCRECHRGVRRATGATRSVAYHDRQPNWLQQHGQAARLEMQTCASCHQQRDCVRCHSDLGLRVNPHGPGFDPERMHKRNPALCLTCHLTDPLRSRP